MAEVQPRHHQPAYDIPVPTMQDSMSQESPGIVSAKLVEVRASISPDPSIKIIIVGSDKALEYATDPDSESFTSLH